MQDNDIYTFKLDYYRQERPSSKLKSTETHNLLKHPSFTELNRLINQYPNSPITHYPVNTLPSKKFNSSDIQNPIAKSCSRNFKSSDMQNPTTRPSSRNFKSPLCSSRSKERIKNEESLSNQCTFRPKINYIKQKENHSIPLHKKLQILSKPKTDTIEKREKLKADLENQEAAKFSYTPQINEYKLTKRIPVQERFLIEKLKYIEREKLKRKMSQESDSECTFRPKIIKRNASTGNPIYQRVDQIQMEKLLNLERLKNQYGNNLIFTPSISHRSRTLSANRRRSSEELSDSEKYLKIESEKNHHQLGISNELCVPYRKPYNHTPFLNRQAAYQDKINNKRKQNSQELDFRPVINRNSAIMAENSRSPKSISKKMKKLSDDNIKKINKQNQIRENFYSKFDFSPEINHKSKKIGRVSSLDDLACNAYKQRIKDKKIEKMMKEDNENCTFKPQITSKKKFTYLKSPYNQHREIIQEIEMRENTRKQKNRSIKYIQDYEELKKCSFKPEIHKNKTLANIKNEIKGIDRFFELKEMARRLSKEKQEREEKAFIKKPEDWSKLFTSAREY
jgi:hypothetical protein